MIQRREEVEGVCLGRMIPTHMWDAVERYLFDREKCGGFFMAVVSNDLVEAFGLADEDNSASMRGWATLLYNDFPTQAWGSREKVEKWLNPPEGGEEKKSE